MLAAIVHQHQPCAGARSGRLAKTQGRQVEHRYQHATMGNNASNPGRRPGDRLEWPARQHFDHLPHIQGETLVVETK
ncbi:hypothetical protein D3C81_2046980 [compost metagenome]